MFIYLFIFFPFLFVSVFLLSEQYFRFYSEFPEYSMYLLSMFIFVAICRCLFVPSVPQGLVSVFQTLQKFSKNQLMVWSTPQLGGLGFICRGFFPKSTCSGFQAPETRHLPFLVSYITHTHCTPCTQWLRDLLWLQGGESRYLISQEISEHLRDALPAFKHPVTIQRTQKYIISETTKF